MTERHEAIVIGAGPAGLAAGAMLRREGIEAVLLERDEVGSSWRNHYERLHLHTVRWLSGLPGLSIDRREGKWVSRDGVVRYLETYARHHRLDVRTGVDVHGLERDGEGWLVRTGRGDFASTVVVVATGHNREAHLPDWPGRDSFAGELLHSADYRNPKPYSGRDVLVVGTGNSGAEIAVDLVEGGAGTVWISVRSGPNILRRDTAGFPSQLLGLTMRRLPPGLVDRMSGVVQRITFGDLKKYGLPPPAGGMLTRAGRDQIPILDIGLIRLIKRGRVKVVPAVEGFDRADVLLRGGRRLRPDAVIAATGFLRGLEPLVGHLGLIAPTGRPVVHGPVTHPDAPNLHFIGFTNPVSGNLRELGIDARKIARAVRRTRARGSGIAPTPSPASRSTA